MLGEFNRSRLVGLPLLILLFEYANELLHVDMLPGIRVDEIELTSDELISELIPGFQQ